MMSFFAPGTSMKMDAVKMTIVTQKVLEMVEKPVPVSVPLIAKRRNSNAQFQMTLSQVAKFPHCASPNKKMEVVNTAISNNVH